MVAIAVAGSRRDRLVRGRLVTHPELDNLVGRDLLLVFAWFALFLLVAAKADPEGRWILQDTFNGRFWVDIETKGEPSRWLTLRALRTLAAV